MTFDETWDSIYWLFFENTRDSRWYSHILYEMGPPF